MDEHTLALRNTAVLGKTREEEGEGAESKEAFSLAQPSSIQSKGYELPHGYTQMGPASVQSSSASAYAGRQLI